MPRDREVMFGCHCEERSDEAIHLSACGAMDCFAALAMTIWRQQWLNREAATYWIPRIRWVCRPRMRLPRWIASHRSHQGCRAAQKQPASTRR